MLLPAALPAQDAALTPGEKLGFHGKMLLRPTQFLTAGAGAGISQCLGHPEKYGQGASGYAKRFASNEAYAVTQHMLALGLNTALQEDPRYFRSTRSGFWPRTKDVIAHTLLTRTDSGVWRVSTWRLASQYGAGMISTAWNPPLTSPVVDGVRRGSIGIGLDIVSNFALEFLPDAKKLFRRK
jgi:hypothetical protein